MDLVLRDCEVTDLNDALLLSQQMNWPHLIEDWNLAFSTGNGLVATVDKKIVGTAFYWPWENKVATVGLVIVDKEYQGQGIGRSLMEKILTILRDYSVRLHATPMGKPLYEKLGFIKTGFIVQHHLKNDIDTVIQNHTLSDSFQIRKYHKDDANSILSIDFEACGMKRDDLVLTIIHCCDVRVVVNSNNQVVGYAAIRKSGLGFSIGPLICRGDDHAKFLIMNIINDYRVDCIRIDTYAGPPFMTWLTETGFKAINKPDVMCLNDNKKLSRGEFKNYGLISQAMF